MIDIIKKFKEIREEIDFNTEETFLYSALFSYCATLIGLIVMALLTDLSWYIALSPLWLPLVATLIVVIIVIITT